MKLVDVFLYMLYQLKGTGIDQYICIQYVYMYMIYVRLLNKLAQCGIQVCPSILPDNFEVVEEGTDTYKFILVVDGCETSNFVSKRE